ncbi:hypothetical protein HQ531_06895 [bacterium]|nr:hypothetical protein [bacterium]
MSGYTILEHRITNLAKQDGYKVSDNTIDILDFIREIKEDPFPFNFGVEVAVEGLDKLLFDAGKEVQKIATTIRHELTSKAGIIDSQKLTVCIIILGKLKYGAYLTVEHAGKDIPLNLIFNTVNRFDVGTNDVIYTTNANLSG